MTSPVGPAWSDGVMIEEGIDVYGFKMVPLPGDRCLIVYTYDDYPDSGWISSRYYAVIVTANGTDSPLLGDKTMLVDAGDVVAGQGWETGGINPGVLYSPGVAKVSDTRVLTLVGTFNFLTGSHNYGSSVSTILLDVSGDTPVIMDRDDSYKAQIGGAGEVYEEWPDCATTGDNRVTGFYTTTPNFGTDLYHELTYRTFDVSADSLDEIASGSIDNTQGSYPLRMLPDAGVWSNGTDRGVIASTASGPRLDDDDGIVTGYSFIPFSIVDGVPSAFASPVEPAWLNIGPGGNLNEGILCPGPEANTIILSTYDVPEDRGNDYLNLTLFDVTPVDVTIAEQTSVSYDDDAGFGYPDAWLPATLTPSGRVIALYSAGLWDVDDPHGAHGHNHQGDPVLLFDPFGKGTWDGVTESQMPRTGIWNGFAAGIGYVDGEYTGGGYWYKDLQATENGLFVMVGSWWTEDDDDRILIAWVPLELVGSIGGVINPGHTRFIPGR